MYAPPSLAIWLASTTKGYSTQKFSILPPFAFSRMAMRHAQLRDSLFESSAAGGRHLREEAVDKALELARSAPLEMQGEVRLGAGRIDSLLGGEGLQPVRSSIVRSSSFGLGGWGALLSNLLPKLLHREDSLKEIIWWLVGRLDFRMGPNSENPNPNPNPKFYCNQE